MKKNICNIFFTLVLICLPSLVVELNAQAPNKFNYQGILRDEKGNPIPFQKLSLKLSILPLPNSLVGEYEEIQSVTTNEFGLYTLQIGGGTSLTGDMNTVKWETGNKYIKIAIDLKGDNNFIDIVTNQLLSVPYAIYADKAGIAKTSATDRTGTVSSNTVHVLGDTNYLTKFTALNNIGKSQIYDNGYNIGIGTSTPISTASIHVKRTTSGQYFYLENSLSNGFGSLRLYNDILTNFASFTKYGSTASGGYTGISNLYPFANSLGFGNNGALLNTSTGNIGFAITKAGTNKLKIHIDAVSERIGIGGNSVPTAQVHFNNTSSNNDTIKFTNNLMGHTKTDGLEIRTNGNNARLINRENGYLLLGTSDTDRIAINGSGNVGVGTILPVAKLDVNGQIRMQGGGAGAGKLMISDSSGLGSWSTPSGAGLISGYGTLNYIPRFTPNGYTLGNSNVIDDGTSVGIGMLPSNEAMLNVNNINSVTKARFGEIRPIYTMANSPMVGFNTKWDWNVGNISYGYTYGSNGRAGIINFDQEVIGGFNILTADSGGSGNAASMNSRLAITNSGTIGIGTSNPDSFSKMHIIRSTNGRFLLLQNSNPTSYGSIEMQNDNPLFFSQIAKLGSASSGVFNGISNLYPSANALFVRNNGPLINTSTGNLGFAITKDTSYKLKLHIDAINERIGIGGKAVPQTPIHFNNTDLGNDTIKFTNQTTGHSITDGTEFRFNGNSTRLINRESSSLILGTSNVDRVTINSSGQVGIGTSSPSTLLDINGQIRIRGGLPAAGKVLMSDVNGLARWSSIDSIIGGNIITGGGTVNYIPRFTPSGSSLGNSQIFQLGNNIGIGTLNPASVLEVNGDMEVSEDATIHGIVIGRGPGISLGNTRVGFGAFVSNTTGSLNTVLGDLALQDNTTGGFNTAIGAQSLDNNTEGLYNTGIGVGSLHTNTLGNGNTSLGVFSLNSNSTGEENTAIGFSADVVGSSISNATALGAHAEVDASNKVQIGDYFVNSIGGQVAWTNYSDGRIKRNVKNNVPGLKFINLLKPVTYNYDIAKQYSIMGRVDTNKYEGKNDIDKINFTGFIAQEVESAASEIGYDFSGIDKSGKIMGLRYSEFVVPLVKAVQELSIENEKLKEKVAKIDELQIQLQNQQVQLEELKSTIIQMSSQQLQKVNK